MTTLGATELLLIGLSISAVIIVVLFNYIERKR
jgi:hypothetical protein